MSFIGHREIYGASEMTVSREHNRIKFCDAQKVTSGRFHTKSSVWMTLPVLDFISRFSFSTFFDPFAGDGDMLNAIVAMFPKYKKLGLDLYNKKWESNDSLVSIPAPKDCFIVTNPPYLAKYSATRKGVWKEVCAYFSATNFDDLYQLALHRLIQTKRPFVAIVPETVINCNIEFSGVNQIVLLSENPFTDTEVPVCVVCVDPSFSGIPNVFLGDNFLGDLQTLKSARIFPTKCVDIKFNVPNGEIGLRAVDLTSPEDKIAFMPAKKLKYDRSQIKISSRLITLIHINEKNLPPEELICNCANKILEKIRKDSCDIIFSAFKGNNKIGIRRRRLDYALARAILEKALADLSAQFNFSQDELFNMTDIEK